MPNCVVRGCKKQSSRDKKQDGITFHTFPNRDQKIKQKWIEIIRKSRKELSWQPTSCSVICSAHFKVDDLYYTKKGLRRVLKNGYPKILPNIIEGLDNVDLRQPSNIHEDPDALDVTNDLYLSHPSTLCDVEIATAPELSVLDLNQASTSCPGQTAVAPDLPVMDLEQPYISCAVQPVQSDPLIFDAPRKHKLEKRVLLLETILKRNKRIIKTLNQKVRRLHKRNIWLRKILDNLKKHNHINTNKFI